MNELREGALAALEIVRIRETNNATIASMRSTLLLAVRAYAQSGAALSADERMKYAPWVRLGRYVATGEWL